MGWVIGLAPSKLLRVLENNVICFHEDPVIKDQNTMQRCSHAGEDMSDMKREVFRGRQVRTQYQYSKGRGGKRQAKGSLRRRREDERHIMHG